MKIEVVLTGTDDLQRSSYRRGKIKRIAHVNTIGRNGIRSVERHLNKSWSNLKALARDVRNILGALDGQSLCDESPTVGNQCSINVRGERNSHACNSLANQRSIFDKDGYVVVLLFVGSPGIYVLGTRIRTVCNCLGQSVS